VEGLTSRVPLAGRLPAVYQDEEFVHRFVAAFDDVLAPVLLSLDGLHHYVDPRLCPPDFLAWVAQWLGIEVDDAWPVAQRREIVMGAAALHRRRGTLPGVVDAVRLTLGLGPTGSPGDPDVVVATDTGGTSWSTTPGTPMPGSPLPGLVVRVSVPDPATVDRSRVDRAVASVKPAHVPHTVDVVPGTGAAGLEDAAVRVVDAPSAEGPSQSPPGLSSAADGQ
jgi:phage tail-like protein